MKRVMTLFLITILFLSFIAAQEVEDSDYWTGQTGAGEQDVEDDEGIDSEYNSETEIEIETYEEKGFCGTSTLATCEEDLDCIVGGCSQAVCQGANEEPVITTCEFRECYNTTKYDAECKCEDKKCQWDRLTESQAREKIREKISGEFQNETLDLNEEGNYEYHTERNAKLFFFFPVKIIIETEVNSETGEIKTKIPWWNFLAVEVKDENSSDWNLEGGTMLAGSESNLTDEELAAA